MKLAATLLSRKSLWGMILCINSDIYCMSVLITQS
jgi:hypothetical protein